MVTIRDMTDIHKLSETSRENQITKMLAATVTHEMMTPLNCIVTFVRSILAAKNAQQVSYFANLIERTTKMLRLNMRDLLDRSLLEVGTFKANLQPHTAHQVVFENVVMMRAQAKSKDVEIVFKNESAGSKEVKHEVDEQRMQQVVMNLLSNAVKFSKPKDKITVSFSAVKEKLKDDLIRISVQDQGIGMSEAEVGKLFTPFYRSQNEESQKANPYGNGLGLSICNNIAKGLGGSLEVYSELGEGSAFQFEFPAKRSKGAKGKKEPAPKNQKITGELESLLEVDDGAAVNTSAKDNSQQNRSGQQQQQYSTSLDVHTNDIFSTDDSKSNAPKVVVADDQQINLEAIKANLMEIGVHQNAEYFVNGQMVIDFVKKYVADHIANTEITDVTRPIHALLLDF